MKKTLGMIMVLALAAGIATHVAAKSEREDAPRRRFVEELLAEVGGTHYPEKMDVKKIASIEIGDTYYHVYEGELDAVGYHIIVFDNYRNYLGYYKSDFPPCNYEIENSIVIDSGTVDDNGESLYYPIPISLKKGLPAKIQIAGIPTKFVKAPKKEVSEAEKAAGDGKIEPEYRIWTITHKGREIPVRAIYIKQSAGKVYLKAEANGVTNPFAISSLSKEDQEYVKQFK
ncbi:MAG: hypothetical protein ABFR33_01105 [Verrucomicrobiota bacterium]